MDIILASSSPRRKKILQKLGYNFKIEVPNIDENNINDLNPVDYVIDVSMRKGLKIHQSFPNDYILSGDTIIEFQNQIISCIFWISISNCRKTLARWSTNNNIDFFSFCKFN